ncbi:ABC transporter ATP-binding protein [Paraflavitalea soli]|uniref:ABC transporter ATP-binding protein n=1 Tax=Paraflavitalea soli TaxID=2315862 RepID=A0A3B7MWZ8_9BACT|nr:ABC transporter ATP-binding protein [Paraflavitalea soli]AXY76205.1 ABC transporter ATP-binding protein [Paraflavitalea soli]
MSVIIQVNHLSKYYKELKAVDDISFTVNQGDIYGFLGQNGAGKSTTIRMLLTLIEPTNGHIELFGMDLKKHRKDILRQIGAVIERPDLYKYLTAYECLSLFARMSGIRANKQQLMAQLEQVGLQERAQSKVKTFSQGMKQRLGISVALVHDPQLIILDEPTNGLDPQGIADIRNLILQLSKQQGKTILISSHLLYEIEMTANRMIIIDKGKKIAEGSVKELFDPSSMLIQVSFANTAEVAVQLQHSKWKDLIKTQEQNNIVFQMDEQQVPALTADLVNMGAAITALQPQHSLEAYFLALTTANRHVDTFTN